ncbi:hypothetical protein HKX48_003883 [Thoreauomyces humboldtii]|nr:hypothetical protein HKX48_003883 [Thoreauomyces humboldtii]
MSVVFYKFKSAKDYDTCTFDGTNISVFDLKREILVAKKLGKGTDFDLAVYHAQTNDEYKDDMSQIPRNTSVLVSRHPASKPGKGTAQRYLTTSMPTGAMLGGSRARVAPGPPGAGPKHHTLNNRAPQYVVNTARDTAVLLHLSDGTFLDRRPKADAGPDAPSSEITGETEEERIANMFKMQTDQWAEAQDRMAQQKPIPRQYYNAGRGGRGGGHPAGGDRNAAGGAGGEGGAAQGGGGWQQREFSSRPPPPGYICYRCGQKGARGVALELRAVFSSYARGGLTITVPTSSGHFINTCPTIGNEQFDRPKLKRTTGIPKIFLKPVDDKHAAGGGVMVTQSGELVIAQPNDQAWGVVVAQNKNYLGAGDVYEMASVPEDLACFLCKKLLRDAVLTSCCRTKFCDECIRTHLLDNDDPDQRLHCPKCSADQSPDDLIADKALRQRVDAHIREYIAGKTLGSNGSPAPQSVALPNAITAIQRTASPIPPAAATASASTSSNGVPIPLPNIPALNRRPADAKPFKVITPTPPIQSNNPVVIQRAPVVPPAPKPGVITRITDKRPVEPVAARRPSDSDVTGVVDGTVAGGAGPARYPPQAHPPPEYHRYPSAYPEGGPGPGYPVPQHMAPPYGQGYDPRYGMPVHPQMHRQQYPSHHQYPPHYREGPPMGMLPHQQRPLPHGYPPSRGMQDPPPHGYPDPRGPAGYVPGPRHDLAGANKRLHDDGNAADMASKYARRD